VLASCYRTVINIVNFQEKVDKTDFENPPFERPDKWQKGDQILHELNIILANEIDNAAELAALLKTGANDLLELAETPENENVFRLSPDIIAQVERKALITFRHKDEFIQYYRRNS